MAYCTSAQVTAEFKDLPVTVNSSITEAKIDRFIEEADAEIDGQLGLKFETPIAGATALIIMRKISILLVTARIKEILQVKTAVEDVNQDGRAGSLRKQAQAMIDKILKGTLALPGATLLSTAGGVRSFAVDEDLEHTFKKGESQW